MPSVEVFALNDGTYVMTASAVGADELTLDGPVTVRFTPSELVAEID